jgi:hypothetical protein
MERGEGAKVNGWGNVIGSIAINIVRIAGVIEKRRKNKQYYVFSGKILILKKHFL